MVNLNIARVGKKMTIRYVRTKLHGKLYSELYIAEGHVDENDFFDAMRELYPEIRLDSKRLGYEYWRKKGYKTWRRAKIKLNSDVHPMTVYYPELQ